MGGSARYIALGTTDYDDDTEGGLRAVLLPDPGAGAPLTATTPRVDRVEVIAPASLPGGYELQCNLRGRSVTVQVPPEGVRQGETFVADVMCEDAADGDEGDDDLSGHRIPHGRWRDGICDCFANGCWHPMLWLACCCRPLAIGQILTRMNLSAMGNPIRQGDDHNHHNGGRRGPRASAFQVVACVFAVYLAVDYAYTLSTMWMPSDNPNPPPPPEPVPHPAWDAIYTVAAILFWTYVLALLIRARAHVRQRYDIPEQYCCVGCEDCCCSFWLPCCTTLQIARHTAEYSHRRSAACCTDTGLAPPQRRRSRHPPHHAYREVATNDDDGAPLVV